MSTLKNRKSKTPTKTTPKASTNDDKTAKVVNAPKSGFSFLKFVFYLLLLVVIGGGGIVSFFIYINTFHLFWNVFNYLF